NNQLIAALVTLQHPVGNGFNALHRPHGGATIFLDY
ncbi:MAG: hypothetical protein ACI89F_001134, partial [Porticoccaceae bacterium]